MTPKAPPPKGKPKVEPSPPPSSPPKAPSTGEDGTTSPEFETPTGSEGNSDTSTPRTVPLQQYQILQWLAGVLLALVNFLFLLDHLSARDAPLSSVSSTLASCEGLKNMTSSLSLSSELVMEFSFALMTSQRRSTALSQRKKHCCCNFADHWDCSKIFTLLGNVHPLTEETPLLNGTVAYRDP